MSMFRIPWFHEAPTRRHYLDRTVDEMIDRIAELLERVEYLESKLP